MPEAWQLTQMQGLPLELKVKKTILRIREWYEAWDGDVFVSFSGGKDSTVLLHIARSIYPGIEAVFDDTGLEYPEIRDFVKTIENVTWIKPKMSFRKVIDKYGYPVVSKSVANTLRGGDKVGSYRWKKLHGQVFLKNGSPSKFNCEKWRFLLDAPFKVSDECCDVMKKRPFHQYERDTGRKSIVATMADESTMRKNSWEKYGCNAFDRVKGPQSRPMSFWTEKDVLLYIVTRKLSYARVYGQIRAEYRGQVIPPHSVRRMMEVCPCVEQELKLYTTGVSRTGCMFCMFGCHLEKTPNRFQRMQDTHPNQWKFCMKPVSEGGLGEREVLEFLGVPWRKEEDDGREN